MFAARDPIAHYYASNYVHCARARKLMCLAELILAIVVKNSPICQVKIPAKVSGYTVISL